MFKEYMHVERLGSDEVSGILHGECYIFPKIDGTNASIWMDGDVLCAGSRTRQLTLEQDNAGFLQWVLNHAEGFKAFFEENPDLLLYGEWLVPHTLRTYRKDAWRQFYIFDVYSDIYGRYLHYTEYSVFADLFPFPIIAPIEIVTNPTEKHLIGLLNRNTYLIADGNGSGEGIVIKRYDFVNQWDHTLWAKIVRNEFKERNLKAFGTPTVRMTGDLESKLAEEYVTRGRVEKMLAKMRDTGPVSRRRIPELLGRVWNEIVTDEMWNIVKDRRNPTIDFGGFNRAVTEEIKRNCPELFG